MPSKLDWKSVILLCIDWNELLENDFDENLNFKRDNKMLFGSISSVQTPFESQNGSMHVIELQIKICLIFALFEFH